MNPFQPPADDPPRLARSKRRGSGYIVEGQLLIAEKGTALPELCLYSGEPTRGQRVTKKLAWAPPIIALLLLISPLIYIVAYLIVRKMGALQYSLSKEARTRRASGILAFLGGFPASIVLITLAGEKKSAPMLLIALALMITALIVGIVRSRLIHVVKIDENYIRLRLRRETAQAFAEALAR